jgi:glycine oxidase
MSQPDAAASINDVIVVGGGVIGMAIAWRCAQRGYSVLVVDPSPGAGASRVAAGMLAPVTELHHGEEELLQLNLLSARRYPSFVQELENAGGSSVGYRTEGTLAVALDADDRAVLSDLHAFQASLGLDVETLSAREARRLEPMLDPRIRGALHVRSDHSVDNRRLGEALLAAAQAAGVRVVRQRADQLIHGEDGVRGIRAGGTRYDASTVVLATGAWSRTIAGLADDLLPRVRPVKGQILRLRTPPSYGSVLTRTVRGFVRGSGVYLVPRADGEIVVGATVEERGFDETVTAGAVYELLRDARELVPAVTELSVTEVAAGLRPGSPDNAPLIGPTMVPGLILAAGHYRNGILLAPVTADLVAELITTGALPEAGAAFSPARFDRIEVQA